MAIPKFRPIVTGNNDLDRVQTSIKATTDHIQSNPVVSGQLITGVVLKADVETAVLHKLGRMVQGWHVSRPQGTGGSFMPTENVAKATTTTVYLTSPQFDLTTDIFFY